MTRDSTHHTEHSMVVGAAPRTLYRLVAEAAHWPAVFGPTVHVRHLELDGHSERFRIWARVGEEVRSWTSRRSLDPAGLRIDFHQEHTRPPIAAMAGSWLFHPLPDGRTQVVLRHDFRTTDDSEESLGWLTAALDRNSPEELHALTRAVGSGHQVDEVLFSFSDTVPVAGPTRSVYDFVHRAEQWATVLPHVSSVRLTEDADRVQTLEMDTVTADGATHTTTSLRVCETDRWIAYKQLVTPRLLAGHSGLWSFTGGRDGTMVTARHTVLLDPSAVSEALGPGSTLAEARAHVRDLLGRNSRGTLRHAAEQVAAASGR